MALCALCQANQATKKNSHILPHFLIKTAINKEGSKLRDYELTYSISENEFVDIFFGRSITLDTIEEYKGRELNEEELAKTNPFAEDDLFCPACENKISKIEEYYAHQVYHPLLKKNFTGLKSDKKGNRIAQFDKVSQEIVLLFVYSIFFRCAVAKYHGFRLKKWERKFRKILNLYLDDSIEKIQQRLKAKAEKFLYLPFINTFFERPEGDDPTKGFVTILHTETPYFIYLNEITFHLYMKEKQVGKSSASLFGLNDIISHLEVINIRLQPFQVNIIGEEKYKKVLNVAFESMANRQMKFIKEAFIEVHKSIFRASPSLELIAYFVHIMLTQEINQGERYGRESMAQAMFTSCKNYYQI